jgi:hypothetical protein
MRKNNRKLALVAYLAFMAIPLYQALDIWFNSPGSYSRATRESWIFQKATEFGTHLFGKEYAYRGMSVFVLMFALLIALALYTGYRQSISDSDNGRD